MTCKKHYVLIYFFIMQINGRHHILCCCYKILLPSQVLVPVTYQTSDIYVASGQHLLLKRGHLAVDMMLKTSIHIEDKKVINPSLTEYLHLYVWICRQAKKGRNQNISDQNRQMDR